VRRPKKLLNSSHQQVRADYLLQLPADHCFIKRIVTCDEKWIYLNNSDIQKQWLDKGQLPVLVAK
jgi:hypothetical protein